MLLWFYPVLCRYKTGTLISAGPSMKELTRLVSTKPHTKCPPGKAGTWGNASLVTLYMCKNQYPTNTGFIMSHILCESTTWQWWVACLILYHLETSLLSYLLHILCSHFLSYLMFEVNHMFHLWQMKWQFNIERLVGILLSHILL